MTTFIPWCMYFVIYSGVWNSLFFLWVNTLVITDRKKIRLFWKLMLATTTVVQSPCVRTETKRVKCTVHPGGGGTFRSPCPSRVGERVDSFDPEVVPSTGVRCPHPWDPTVFQWTGLSSINPRPESRRSLINTFKSVQWLVHSSLLNRRSRKVLRSFGLGRRPRVAVLEVIVVVDFGCPWTRYIWNRLSLEYCSGFVFLVIEVNIHGSGPLRLSTDCQCIVLGPFWC